jgi:hypothetical protein
MFRGMFGVASHLQGLSLAIQDALAEGSGRHTKKAKKTNSENCGLHKSGPFPRDFIRLKELAGCPVWRGF